MNIKNLFMKILYLKIKKLCVGFIDLIHSLTYWLTIEISLIK